MDSAIWSRCPFSDNARDYGNSVFVDTNLLPYRDQWAFLGSLPRLTPQAAYGLIGEGFDDSRLDTLFLVMPISWTGTLAQYVGRLHRDHDGKREVIVYDYVDRAVPVLAGMAIFNSLHGRYFK